MRLIASSIVVLAGAICFGLTMAGDPPNAWARDAARIGGFVLLAGSTCFAIEFASGWRRKSRWLADNRD